MTYPLCDTDVIVRLISGDDPAKQDRAIALFEKVERGTLSLAAPDTVIADAVFVLTSKRLYNMAREEVAAKLTTLVRLRNFHVAHRRAVLRALQLFGTTPNLDFGDAMLVALAQQNDQPTIYSYDMDFDRFSDLMRREP